MLLYLRDRTLIGISHLVGWIKVALIVQYSPLLPTLGRVALVSVPL